MLEFIKEYEVGALHLYCGIGGGAKGFEDAEEEWKGVNALYKGRIKTLAGIDVDPAACEDFRNITGAPAFQMDLFERRDYIAFHGKQPPEGWQEATPEDIRKTTSGVTPDIVFLSAPCKGFSGLLPEKSAKTDKYQALNRLTVRGIFLTLEAYRDDLPAFILFENVPRIKSRGVALLNTIIGMLESYGYVTDGGKIHDCGEAGGLGQRRKRFLLASRNPQKVTSFVYEPPKQRVKSIGEIIGPMPLPGDPTAGPMHKLSRLQWKTWVRLALIPPGGDWRDLENIKPEEYRLEYVPRGGGSFGVQDWDSPAHTVTGNAKVNGSNATSITDPRLISRDNRHPEVYQVVRWDEPGPCVTGTRFGSGSPAIADNRIENFANSYRICKWDKPAGTITSGHAPSNGGTVVEDPRTGFKEGTHHTIYKVRKWDDPSNTVTGAVRPNNGAITVADPRGPQWRNGWKCTGAVGRVNKWDSPTDTVIGHSGARGNGAANVADPRLNCTPRSGTMGVQAWDKPGSTVIGAGDIHAGSAAVADPRIPKDNEQGIWVIIALDGSWHRPLTTLELAALQGFPLHLPDGRPLQLTGNSDAKWRERIGNAVPPPAAKSYGEAVLRALLPSIEGAWVLGTTDIWVKPIQHINDIKLNKIS